MSRTEFIAGNQNLVDEVLASLKGEENDYSATAVVFGGKRPGHFLRKAIARRSGRSFIPPRIFAMDGFVDFLYRETMGRRDDDLHLLDAVAILYDMHEGMERRLGGQSFETLDAFLPIGSKLLDALEELCIARVSPRAAREALVRAPMKNGEILAEFYSAFYAYLRDHACSTRAFRYAEVADCIATLDFGRFTSVIVAGFFGLSTSEQTIFRHLLTLEQCIFIFQEGPRLAERLAPLGINPPAARPAKPRAAISLFNAPDTHGEVLGLNTRLKEYMEGGNRLDERAVVVLPSADALFPVVHWTLPMLPRDSYNISLSYPGTRTPVFGFLNCLFDLIGSMEQGRVYAPDYIKFVLHPYTKNIRCGARTDVTRILFHQIEQKLAREKALTFFALEDLENDTVLIDRAAAATRATEEPLPADRLRQHLILIHDQTIRRMSAIESIGDGARRAMDILLFISNESTADRHDLFRPFILPMLEECSAILESRIAGRTLANIAQYCSLLRTSLKGVAVPFHGTPLRGLQVLGFLETRNLQFDRVFVLDLNDDVIPGSGALDILLPEGIRASLGLPLRRDGEDIAAYHFDLLLQGARNVDLFFRTTGKKEKSRFVERILWVQQQEAGDPKAGLETRRVAFNVQLANRAPEKMEKTPEMLSFLKGFAYSATALDSYLQCPLFFTYAHAMNLAEKEEVEEEIDRPGLGRFVHSVLAQFDRDNIGRELNPHVDRVPELLRLVERDFEKMYGRNVSGARFLLRERIKEQLARFQKFYQDHVLKHGPVRLLALEQKMEISKGGYTFKGVADRIEQRGDRIYILDFKTGHDEKRLAVKFPLLDPADPSTWQKAIGSSQLPLYMMLYAEQESVEAGNIYPAYIMLGKNAIDERIECGLFAGMLPDSSVYARLEQAMFGIVGEINNPAVPLSPPVDLKKACPGCTFAGVCGTKWVTGWESE